MRCRRGVGEEWPEVTFSALPKGRGPFHGAALQEVTWDADGDVDLLVGTGAGRRSAQRRGVGQRYSVHY